jgi:diguanylate cyclase (GGDEF)-like protein/PAS domain S-box-containing protein
MTAEAPPRSDEDREISVLIKTLRVTDQRLEELTAGEVDTVADREGRSYVLRRAQTELRYHEAARQAAILNALPAYIVLLDQSGVIASVNEAWRELADSNHYADAAHGVGVNYLAVCDGAWGPGAAIAHEVAAGIRSVLTGGNARFSMEYPCDMPSGRAWFLLTVTPLDEQGPHGAVVMHVNITEEKRGEQSLLHFAAAMDATVDAIYLVDRTDMQFVHCNDAWCRMQNKTRKEMIAEGLGAAFGIPLDELAESYDRLIAGESGEKPLELLRHRPDGSLYWLEVRRQAQLLDQRWTIVSMVRDVTERKLAEQRIAQLNRVQAVLSGINSLIVRARDRSELFKEACRIAVEAGGFAMAWIGILDRGLLKMVPVASVGATDALLACIEEGLSLKDTTASISPTVRVVRLKKSVVVTDVRRGVKPEAERLYAQAGIRSFAKLPLIVADEVVGVLALYAKDTEFFHSDEMRLLAELADDVAFAVDHIEKREKLEYLSYYDVLTGLANRVLFLDRVTQHLRAAAGVGGKVALVLIGMERFKTINDSLGRPGGDELLRQVAAWLTRSVGDASRVARGEGDHFAVVLPAVAADTDLTPLLDKTLSAFLKHSFQWNGMSYRLAARTGVALFPDDGTDVDTLYGNAEAALRKAKIGGVPYLFYARSMTNAGAERLSLENQLRHALEREEFVLHYQPKVSLKTGKIMGAEALIRWNDPHTGLVPPGRFIPILEETGMINEVGRWALRKAVSDYLSWSRAGLRAVRIAVNVSPLQLGNRGFVGEIERVIGVDGLAAGGLELEITESLIMSDVKHSVTSLQKIRAMGVTLAVDDFGTGFSSLSYLARLPINTLKIDRSFVLEMTNTSEAHALVTMIINLAHSLKLTVVAEGVETEQQAGILRTEGCDQLQGYLYSKPVPEAIFAARFLGLRTLNLE